MTDECRKAFEEWCLNHDPAVNLTPDFRLWQAAWNSRTPDPRLTVAVVGRIIGIVRSELGDDGNSDNDSFYVGLHDKLTEALANIGELG